MKICSRCLRQFDDDGLTECPDDGAKLRSFSDQMTQLVGKVLDERWHLEAKIGEGGMGEVYRARQVNVDRLVAVKILRLALASSEEYVARFFREADIATSVQHPHFVSIFDFGQTSEGQLLYIAMELLEGEPLGRVLCRRRLSLEETLTIAAQVCAALGAAHDARIVHRDLKPDNIFLLDVPDGEPFAKVLDFGIAKHLDSKTRVTRTGQLFGTPEYMSPEQCEGSDGVDGRSDLYSVGCILYESLTGRSPFQRASIVQTLLAQVSDDPEPFSTLGIPVPSGVRDIVFRLLEKHPDNRFADALETRSALLEELDRLRKNSVELRAFESVSKRLEPRQRSARTISYSELGHPLRLEGILADSAKSAISKEADRRRHAESERETDEVREDVRDERPSLRRITWAIWTLLVIGLVGGYTVITGNRDAKQADRARGAVAAISAVADAASAAEGVARHETARSQGRQRANTLAISATVVALGGDGHAPSPRLPSPDEPRGEQPERPSPLVGVRTQTSMSQRLLRKQGDLLACYNRRENTDEEGSVEFRLRIEPDGSVASANVGSADLQSKSVLDCMRAIASKIRFTPAESGATFVKSLKFESTTR